MVRLLTRWPLQVAQARQKTKDLKYRAIISAERRFSRGEALHSDSILRGTINRSIQRYLIAETHVKPKTTDPLPEDAIAIQKLTRGYLARKNLRQMQKNEAATKIQALRRGHLARR